MKNIYLSAAHKSSGKTIISLGLCAALKQKSFKVQSFKKGPDYIDPIWLSQASGNPCYNLDFYNMDNDEIINLYDKHSSISDISIIEGNKGLFDGITVTGGDANADLAKLLNLPVVLVLDVSGITRGVAPLINGYLSFDKKLNISGVILNKVASERHQTKLINAVEHYNDIPVLGAVRRSSELIIDERHLGLKPANETPKSQQLINTAAKHIAEQVDLDKVVNLSKTTRKKTAPTAKILTKNITIAVAKDSAFGFYYQDDLDMLTSLGVEIKYFNTLKDKVLPKTDGLFIGGGFPEMQISTISSNKSLLNDIKIKIKNGLPTYAECGGLMYLTKQITQKNKTYKMAGIIDADTIMEKKPVGRGYVELKPTNNHPWDDVAKHIFAHEFHYSKLENINPNTQFAYKVKRGVGVDNNNDGIIIYNLLATYTHLRSVGNNNWAKQFVDFIKVKSNSKNK